MNKINLQNITKNQCTLFLVRKNILINYNTDYAII
jgi:hypothetical protein